MATGDEPMTDSQFVCDKCGEKGLLILSNTCSACGLCLCDDCALEHDCRVEGDEVD